LKNLRYQFHRLVVSGSVNFAMLTGFYPWFSNRGKRRQPLARVVREWKVATGMSILRPLGYLGERLSPSGDYAGRPIIMVHGYGMSRACFRVLAARLAGQDLGPIYGFEYLTSDSIPEGARGLAEMVERVASTHATEEVDVIGHSLGGLVSRYYVVCGGGARRVKNLITIGSPHSGIATPQWLFGKMRRELAIRSEVIREMDAAPVPPEPRLLAIGSDADTLVRGRYSGFQGAEHILYDDLGHLELLVDDRVATVCIERLLADGTAEKSR
jgi:pimeloyl-ACP methyl ester carboxylesterase